MNIKYLIFNRIITKIFSFYKKYTFDFTTMFYAVSFYFSILLSYLFDLLLNRLVETC